MRLLEFFSGHPFRAQSDPTECRVLSNSQFAELVESQPWSSVRQWSDFRYQYAICEKAS
jgi:hypothetical protein